MSKTPDYQKKASKNYHDGLAAQGKVLYRRVVKKEVADLLDQKLAELKAKGDL